MEIKKTLLTITLTSLLAACGSSSSSNNDADDNSGDSSEVVDQNQGDPSDSADTTEDDSKVTNNKLVILNQMKTGLTTSSGVRMDSLLGNNSIGDIEQSFVFEEPVEFGGSVVVYIPDNQCDVYWDLTPTASEVQDTWGNTGENLFVGCGQTLTCESQIFEFFTDIYTGYLDCE